MAGDQVFAVKAKLLVSIHGVETWINQTIIFTLHVDQPTLNLIVIDSYWSSRITSGYVENIGLNILAQSLSFDQIRALYARLIPITGLRAGHGLGYAVWVRQTPINYGEYFTMAFNELTINTSRDYVVARLEINATLSIGNALYNVSKTIYLKIPLDKPEKPLRIVSIRYIYNGASARLLPNTRNLRLEITLLNTLPETIETLTANITWPGPFKPVYSSDTCTGVAGGATCTLSYIVDVLNITPGPYNVGFKINMVVNTAGSLVYMEDNITIKVVVEDPADYMPSFKLLNIYWGSGRPQYIYPGHRRAPLTITIMNNGFYTGYDTYVELKPLNKTIGVLNNNLYCGDLGSGQVCSLTYYLDLRDTRPGLLYFDIIIYSYSRVYGSMNKYVEVVKGKLVLVEPETVINSTEPIQVVGSGWLNDWPVYPGSEKAVYTATIANLYPYTVSSIYAELIPPPGMYPHDWDSLIDYVPGPVNPLSETTLSFTLDIGDLRPGDYVAYLKITYYVEAGPTGYRVTKSIPVVIRVSDPRDAVILVQYGWLGGEPPLDSYGVNYYVLFRDNEYPVMNGVLLNISLPPGITSSLTNGSQVVLTPTVIISATTPATTLTPQNLFNMLLQGQQNIPVNPTVSRGDYIAYVLKLNLNLSRPGLYIIWGRLDFIDHWGSRQYYSVEIPLVIHGKPHILDVKGDTVIRIVNGTATYHVMITNNYTTPLTNVYVVLAPATPIVIPVDNTRYYNVLPPGGQVVITYKLYYNPLQLSFATMTTYSSTYSSSTAVFTLAVIYRDASGAVNIYNTTLATLIEPFIDIVLSSDTKAEYINGLLKVNGIIINRGLDTAHSVEVIVTYGNNSGSSFIGDLDPASQAAFRIEFKTKYLGSKAHVIISYRDEYNTVYTRTYELPVYKVEPRETTQSTTSESSDYELIVVSATIVFLAIVLIIIYRFIKQHSRKLGLT